MKFPSEPPPVPPSSSVLPEPARDVAGPLVQPRRRPGPRSSGGRSNPPRTTTRVRGSTGASAASAASIRLASSIAERGRPRPRAPLRRRRSAACRPRSSPTLTDTPRGGILQAFHGRNLPGDLVNGAGAFAGIDAGVRRDARDDDLELAAALAAGLHRASRKRRLEDEHGVASSRLFLDRGARGLTADLLVGRPEHDDPSARDRRRARRSARAAAIPSAMPAFMSNEPGPVQPALLAPDRHSRQLADGPDRVEVAEQQHLPIAVAESRRARDRPRRSRSAARHGSRSLRAARPAPARSNPPRALSVLGDSSRPSASAVSTSQSVWLSHHAASGGYEVLSVIGALVLLRRNSSRVAVLTQQPVHAAVSATRRRRRRRTSPARRRSRPDPRRRRQKPVAALRRVAAPTQETLGLPIYPGAQFLTRTTRDGSALLPVRHERDLCGNRRVLQDLLEGRRRARLRRASGAPVGSRTLPRGNDGVPAGHYGEGLRLEGSKGWLNPRPNANPARFITIIQIVPGAALT